jgi:hypothetical protein
METSRTRTLRRALEACDGKPEALANALAVTTPELSRWLVGIETPPTRVYLDALDLVARGPLRRLA